MDTDAELDVISKAFQWDLDLFLQKVFLHLDPYSLKSCRQVRQRFPSPVQQYTSVLLRCAVSGMTLSLLGCGEVPPGDGRSGRD